RPEPIVGIQKNFGLDVRQTSEYTRLQSFIARRKDGVDSTGRCPAFDLYFQSRKLSELAVLDSSGQIFFTVGSPRFVYRLGKDQHFHVAQVPPITLEGFLYGLRVALRCRPNRMGVIERLGQA